ncbi:unnamed protein product [Adineta steineri]|uniref:Uncharacterized protein n=1 Tax=Adineta steineri TaxID=433720 RepID=A0A816G176_9BILA|nr:unnamed protein product [Adineta steineri]CAF1427868.1 unnamed protein product [Adineta steineri]CAF1429001.1 unnamed protein product [Adineta steineri]CAF1571055.1 unnamed protein product [Adineta steineri]CAF1668998.1 unnamed protein product [Adineta steineri]
MLSIPDNPQPLSKRKQKAKTNTKSGTSILTQQKVTPEVISNSTKQQQHNTNIPAIHVQNPVNNHQKQAIKSSLTWSNREEIQGIDYLVKPSSTLLSTAPVLIPSSPLVQANKTNDILPVEDKTSSFHWNSNDYHSSNPVQQPSSELRATTFPTYSLMNYAMDNSDPTWNDIPVTSSNQVQ